MNRPLLCLQNVTVAAFGKDLLSKVSLTMHKGEIHVVMGPNGAGKSTLSKALAGHPDYAVTSGTIAFRGEDLVSLTPEERALRGLFLSFQNPVEIPGVSNISFLKASYNAILKAKNLAPVSSEEFERRIVKIMDDLQLKSDMRNRDVNVGFSGGEKKRNEIVQMVLLEPDLAILDEIDSGLDVDGLKTVSSAIQSYMNPTRGLLIITHYQRLLDYVKPDHVHVMIGGRIVLSGGFDLAQKLEQSGYEWVAKEAL
jgi:Fe-S cluster assembly ATP-binding protein